MTPDDKRCPRCGRFWVRRDTRSCISCQARVLFPGDDGAAFGDLPWFMWVNRGVRGTGWYRREALEKICGLKF
jgi:hypothetical protein